VWELLGTALAFCALVVVVTQMVIPLWRGVRVVPTIRLRALSREVARVNDELEQERIVRLRFRLRYRRLQGRDRG
jgi:cobalamin biosynthesis protein CobD/CbiB